MTLELERALQVRVLLTVPKGLWDPPGFVHSGAGSKSRPINISMTVDFRVLHDVVSTAELEQICAEMDQCLERETLPDMGRTAMARRYRINAQQHLYPITQQFAMRVMEDLPDEMLTFMAFVEQHRSNSLHTDNHPNQGRGHSILLPLRHVTPGVDRTVVFDHSTITDLRQEQIDAYQAQQRIIHSARKWPHRGDHQRRYQLEHCDSVVDHMTVAGVFEYRLGDAVCFDAHAIHAGSDWQRHSPERQHKDYLLIHTTIKQGPFARQFRNESY